MLICSDVYRPLLGADNKPDLKTKNDSEKNSIQGVKND